MCVCVYIKNILLRWSSSKFSFANKNKYSTGKMHSIKRIVPFSHGMAT